MSLWQYFFDSEGAQRADIERLKTQVASADGVSHASLEDVDRIKRQLNRVELVLEGLVRALAEEKLVDREKLVSLIQRIDLEDGIEDGRIGPDRVAGAAKCPFCAKPLNPKRSACIYCGREPTQKDAAQIQAKTKTALIICARCLQRVLRADVRFAEEGPICKKCDSSEG